MQTNTPNPSRHTSRFFEGELTHLHELLTEMADLLLFQMDEVIESIRLADVDAVVNIIARHARVNSLFADIDAEVMVVIARQAPVAGDLRCLLTTSKIAVELERIGDEIVNLSKLLLALLKQPGLNLKLLGQTVELTRLLRSMLLNVTQLIARQEIGAANEVMRLHGEFRGMLEGCVKHHLSSVLADSRLISLVLNIMDILKSLESSSVFCRNIADYMNIMINGTHLSEPGEPASELLP